MPNDNDSKKDYFNIVKMTEHFRDWSNREIDTKTFDGAMRVWDLRFKLAMAQQLSVISARLGEIVERAKNG